MSSEEQARQERYEANKAGAIIGGTVGATVGLAAGTLVAMAGQRSLAGKIVEGGRRVGVEVGMRIQENERNNK